MTAVAVQQDHCMAVDDQVGIMIHPRTNTFSSFDCLAAALVSAALSGEQHCSSTGAGQTQDEVSAPRLSAS
jgi:hypothetical protein